MRSPIFLGIDVGTSACKTVALSVRGAVLATSTRSYPTRYGPDGEATQDAGEWLRAVRLTVRACLADLTGRRVEAMGVTAPAHYAVLVDDEAQPLARVLLASDGRPEPVVAELRARIGRRFSELTFEQLTGSWTFPQLVWLRRTAPDLWSRLRLVLVAKDYVRYRLTGEALTDPTDAAGTGLYDQRAGTWAPSLLEEVGLSVDHLPHIRPALESGGKLGRDWARLLGIPVGTPVAVGATDTAAELVSVGAVTPGDAMVKVASTATVVVVSAEPRPHPALLTYPHVLNGRWYTLAATSSAATALTWLGHLLYERGRRGATEVFDEMDRQAARAAPGSGGAIFLPFLVGERTPYWDRDLRAAFAGLTASHGRSELCRAVMEGVAFSLRSCRDLMRSNGLPADSPYLVGGGNASSVWREIIVAALGVTGRLAEPHGPAVGAALIARATATGELPRAKPRLRAVRPRQSWVTAYERHYDFYRSAAESLASLSHELSSSARRATAPTAPGRVVLRSPETEAASRPRRRSAVDIHV